MLQFGDKVRVRGNDEESWKNGIYLEQQSETGTYSVIIDTTGPRYYTQCERYNWGELLPPENKELYNLVSDVIPTISAILSSENIFPLCQQEHIGKIHEFISEFLRLKFRINGNSEKIFTFGQAVEARNDGEEWLFGIFDSYIISSAGTYKFRVLDKSSHTLKEFLKCRKVEIKVESE